MLIKTRALIDYQDFPGGPTAYLQATNFSPESAIAAVTNIFVNYFTQGLMVRCLHLTVIACTIFEFWHQLYRCYVIFRDKIWCVTIPLVLFCGTIGVLASAASLNLTVFESIRIILHSAWPHPH
jgi:hypothetical protein